MRWFSIIVFILFNIYLIESANRTESDDSEGGFESENVRGGARDKSDRLEEVLYDEYEYEDGQNSISGNADAPKNSTETADAFPNEVFLSLRNITADAATAFRSFTNRNDVVDLQASASDNLNVTANETFGDAESAGINLRALRDAGHPPQIIEESLPPVHLPYKHTKIDTADLSDCALQGEWKPIGVAHGHLHVGGGESHQADVLQSVGSYAVPNKVIPWQQNLGGGDQALAYNHKPSGLYSGGTGGNGYGSGYGYVDSGGASGSGLGQFQKMKMASMLSPPPVPPIIFGKKPGYWKLPKTKHKFFPGKGRRPGGVYGFSSQVGHGYASGHYGGGGGHGGGAIMSGYGGFSGAGHGMTIPLSGASGLGHGMKGGGVMVLSGGSGYSYGGGGAISGGSGHGFGAGASLSGGSGHGYGGSGGAISGGSSHGYGGGASVSSSHAFGGAASGLTGGSSQSFGSLSISEGSGHGFGSGGSISGGSGHGYGSGGAVSGGSGYVYGGGASISSSHVGSGHVYGGGASISGGSSHGLGAGGFSSSGNSVQGYGGGGGSLSLSTGSSNSGHSVGGGAVAAHLSGGSSQTSGVAVEELHSGSSLTGASGYISQGGGSAGGHLISASALGSGVGEGQAALLIQNPGSGGHLVTLNHGGGDNLLPEAAFLTTDLNEPSGGGHYQDSTFSSTHVSQGIGGGSSLPDASFLSSHLSQDFAVHGQGISDDLSSSSTFTCGKNHDHNTNYHTATFQVADHDHPSSVDVLRYGGDAAVLIQAGDAPFREHALPERKHYKAAHLSDSQGSGSDNRNELTSQAAKLTAAPLEQDAGQTEEEPTKLDDEEPERHSYYHEITKVTKIPATSVGTVEYTFSKYETKPQTFSTESESPGEEPEVEQPQIIRELEHLSNKFQLDIENPQKLFEDPPSQELGYHYPFQETEHNQENGKPEAIKEDGQEGVTEFPYQFYHETPNKFPVVYKKPIVKYAPQPGKPHFHQKTVGYVQQKPPLVVLRKHKPKQFLKKKQNYEVHEQGGERRRPVGEIFPPQKFPKQFHNPKPNFAVDRPKNGWRQDSYHEYKYDHSHGKKVKKFKTKGKLVAPILIRRPVSPAPVIRVVEVTG